MRLLFPLLLIVLMVQGCAEKTVSPANSSGFETASPINVGLDPGFIHDLTTSAAALDNIYSFIVLKDGKLAVEEYMNGKSDTSVLHIRSITKSISSILVGIALDKELLEGTEEKIAAYFPDYLDSGRNDFFNEITIQHVLDMQSGFAWNEGREAIPWYTTISDTWGYLFDFPVDTRPGTSFNYCSGAVSLLTRSIEQKQDLDYQDYASTHLFRPLNISEWAWERDGLGNFRSDAGLQLRPVDLAKIGFLYMKKGLWKDSSIVSRQWIESSWNFKIDLQSDYGPLNSLHYSNLWWTNKYKGKSIFMGIGYGGQLLLCVPDLNLVVVANHEYRVPAPGVGQHSQRFLNDVFVPLMDHILEQN